MNFSVKIIMEQARKIAAGSRICSSLQHPIQDVLQVVLSCCIIQQIKILILTGIDLETT